MERILQMVKQTTQGCIVFDERVIMAQVMSLSEPWYVKEIIFEKALKAIVVKIDFRKGSTFYYDSQDLTQAGVYKVFDTKTKTVRHYTYGQYPLYLEVRVPRIKALNNILHLLTPPWFGYVRGFTLEYEAHILRMAQSTPVRSISSISNLTRDQIWKIIDTYVTMARALEDYSEVSAIGMDETSIRKHHKYITLFIDLKKSEPS